MPISGNVPEHLVIGARTGFLVALKRPDMPWARVATQFNADAKATTMVDLGAAPMPLNDKGGAPAQDYIEKSQEVTTQPWRTTVWISYNAVQDDQTGKLESRVKSAADRFQQHLNNLVFKTLNAGDATTYHQCYDGLEFFDASHVDAGAAYQTVQSNVNALALSLDNFETVYVASQLYRDDQGEYCGFSPNLLVVPPALQRIAAQIAENTEAYDTANRETNPYKGAIEYLVTPQFSSAAWALLDTNETTKPLIVVIREQPALQDYWFDSKAPDGGRYYFSYYGRYDVWYGDWRLGSLGNT